MGRPIFVLVLALAVTLGSSVGCGSESTGDADAPDPTAALRIASFDFSESEILAELYAQAAESAGVPVVRMGAIGPREVVAPAMELDHIDLVPEYVGTARTFAGATGPVESSAEAYAGLVELLEPKGLTALVPAPAEDTNVFVVTSDLALRENLHSISDLADLASSQRFGGPPECPDRPLCLAGLEAVYGLRFAEFVPQRSLEFTAEALRRREIDVGLLFSTSSQLVAMDLVALDDDRGLQPPENVVPVVRLDAVDRWGPELVAALNAVSAALTTEALRAMNLDVTNGAAVPDVAGGFLAAAGGSESS